LRYTIVLCASCLLSLSVHTFASSRATSNLIDLTADKHGSLAAPLNDKSSIDPKHAYKSETVEIELRVRGIGLGSSYKVVRRYLGIPKKSQGKRISDTTCGAPHKFLELTYAGLVIGLQSDPSGGRFTVVSVNIVNSIWKITPGIRIGMKYEAVVGKLGRPSGESDENGSHRLQYVNKGNDGFANLYFKNRQLARVTWESNLC
jgi:hypothetical protein